MKGINHKYMQRGLIFVSLRAILARSTLEFTYTKNLAPLQILYHISISYSETVDSVKWQDRKTDKTVDFNPSI
jgi:hypothetical protein